MAKDRVQVQDLRGPQPVTPRATPVDTYHRPNVAPANTGPSELDQLVGALSNLQPTINQYASIKHAEQTQQQMSEGEKAVLADKRLQNRAALKAAVDRGDLPAARNPWFLQGAKQQVYRLQGEAYDRQLREAYAKSDAQNGDDISGFISGNTQTYLELNEADASDPEFSKILLPMMERSQANLFAHHRDQRDRQIEQSVIDNTDMEVGNALDKAADEALNNNTALDPDAVAKQLHDIVEEQYKNGLSGANTNKILANAIARKAEMEHNTKYLGLMDKITTGPGTLGQIGWVKELRAQTEDNIHTWIERNNRETARAIDDNKKAVIQETQGKALAALLDNPGANIGEYQKALAAVDAPKASEMFGWQTAAINHHDNYLEDGATVLDLNDKVYNKGEATSADIASAWLSHKITKSTAESLTKDVARSKEFRAAANDRTVQDSADNLFKLIAGSGENFIAKSVDAQNGEKARQQLNRAYVDWRAKNPDAPEGDKLDFLNKQSDILLKRYAGESTKTANQNNLANDYATPTTLDNVTLKAPQTVQWGAQPIWPSVKDLDQDTLEYKATKGRSGRIVEIAAHLGITPLELVQAQQRVLLKK
jgi:hypothetical protein